MKSLYIVIKLYLLNNNKIWTNSPNYSIENMKHNLNILIDVKFNIINIFTATKFNIILIIYSSKTYNENKIHNCICFIYEVIKNNSIQMKCKKVKYYFFFFYNFIDS